MRTRRYYFFIGTVAELIKLIPLMREFSRRSVPFKVISSGQNVLAGSDLLAEVGATKPDIVLSDKPIRKSAAGLIFWFLSTLLKSTPRLHKEFRGMGQRDATLIVHGDTISTVMGALLGRCNGLTVAHVEAGLRSFNFLQPFPEEIDRYLTSYLANIHFCPYAAATFNLRHRAGIKVDTTYNTNIDSLNFALARAKTSPLSERLRGQQYFIFIMHRQENLLNTPLAKKIVDSVLQGASPSLRCVFVMHDLTRSSVADLGLVGQIEGNPNVVVSGRLPYLDFIEVLDKSEFIITDGGGNQQECYYLGKPCLLLRNVTEGNEGLGGNVLLSNNDASIIREFIANYKQYQTPPVRATVSPSSMIADVLIGDLI